MLHTVSDVMNFQATTESDSFPVTEIFVDGHGGRIRFVAVDIGGWFDSTHAIVGDSRFGVPDTRRRTWPVDIKREEIEAQPRWDNEGWLAWFSDLTAKPMLYAGPASAGYDPLMLEQLRMQSEDGERDHRGDTQTTPQESAQAENLVEGLMRSSSLLGMTARGHDDDLGHISDLLFEASAMRVSYVVIDNEKIFRDSRYCIPFAQLREVDEDATSARLDLTLHSLANAPKRTEMKDVDQSSEFALPGAYYHVGM